MTAGTQSSNQKSGARDSGLPGYHDDPDAISLQTNPEGHFEDQHPFEEDEEDDFGAGPSSSADGSVEQPPSYEHSEAIEATARGNEARARTVVAVEDRYTVVDFGNRARSFNGKQAGTDKEVSYRMDPRLSDPAELHDYALNCLRWVPPRPIVWIQGWHWATRRDGDNKKKRERETDFEIMLSLQPYLGPAGDVEWWKPRVVDSTELAYRGSWRKTRAPGVRQELEVGIEEGPTLKEWCEVYAKDRARLKVFRVSRSVSGIDEEYIQSAVQTLIRRLHYRGHLETHLIVEDRAVDIYSEHWVNRIRTSWVRWIFYLTFLWIVTWPILYLFTRRWHVFFIDWPFSLPWPDRGDGARRYATVSERDWFHKHEELLEQLVLEGFKGNATNLPLRPTGGARRGGEGGRGRRGGLARGRGRGRGRGGESAGGPATGNRNVDGAINALHAGFRGWNALQNTLNGRGTEEWGHDD